MKTIQKITSALLILSAAAIPVFTFDWPQENIGSDKFFSFFGQKRAETISNSLIFAEPETAKVCDKGQVAVIITEHEDGFNWFESTLGNAVIVAHEDSLTTVYANLDQDNFNKSLFNSTEVTTGTVLSTTGNSAWQEQESFLEFQIIDTKNHNYINPLILMPRIGKEESLTLTDIKLQNKFGKFYDLDSQKNIPAGVYKVFRKKQNLAVPYKTTLFVNGAETEKITFDTLKMSDKNLAVEGRKFYTINELYIENDLMLMGELYLPHGKDTISLIVTDFSGNEKSRIYNVTVF
ncbi:MAG: peptidoglycan DD-metalloendopeptidase family protein [Treponema sp.]|nr:peptidoglycan DD-metalloendopeptidase family protein [Candidatus Treponema merdequi]